MIVFWKDFGPNNRSCDWRAYIGNAKLEKTGYMQIRPCNGPRKKLTNFIAFDDVKFTPPKLHSALGFYGLGDGVCELVSAKSQSGAIARYIPKTYIDRHGNIRQTDEKITLLLAGPDWNEIKERELQEGIALPF